jgi:uncharacterized membrane protein YraQ (UPF0718 family)
MQRLVATAARHAAAYADLLIDVAGEINASLKLQVELLTASIVLGVAGIVATWASIVLYAWELPSRNIVATLMAVMLVAAAVLCARLAIRSGRRGPKGARLEQELRLDRELLDTWSHSQ